MEISKWRMIYLLEHALDYLEENDLFFDFTENWCINWSQEELQYFNISDGTKEDLKEYGYIESEEEED